MSDLRTLGTEVPREALGGLTPETVLDSIDRPMVFTTRLPNQQLVLAYWVDEDDEGDVRLLVPTETSIIERLSTGNLTVREALDQPWAWLAFETSARAVSFRDLPTNCLPRAGVYLQPEFAPVLSVRFTGNFDENSATASVISRATTLVRYALKPLLDFASETVGPPSASLRRLYDLPARRLAYGSFEVDFGSPSQMEMLGDDAKLLHGAAELLQKGLDWVSKPGSPLPPETAEWDAILAALRQLVPPGTGLVSNVELGGKLAPRGVKLTRYATRVVINALRTREGRESPEIIQGYVREFDRDQLTFIVREEPFEGAPEYRCFVHDDLADDLSFAFESEERLVFVGHRSGAAWIHVLQILGEYDPSEDPPDTPPSPPQGEIPF